jgi:hypothetical protein
METLLQNIAAFAATGMVVGLALPHPNFPPLLYRAAEAAFCSVIFGGAFALGAGGFQEGINLLAIAAGAAGVALYLLLVALSVMAVSRRPTAAAGTWISKSS